jgi:hypothetical protein
VATSRLWLVVAPIDVYGNPNSSRAGVKGAGSVPDAFWRAMRIAVGDISKQAPLVDLVDGPLAKEAPIISYDKYLGKVVIDLTQDIEAEVGPQSMDLAYLEEITVAPPIPASVMDYIFGPDSDEEVDFFVTRGNCPSL